MKVLANYWSTQLHPNLLRLTKLIVGYPLKWYNLINYYSKI